MSYAEYTDREGREWRVWYTRPLLAEVVSILPSEWKEGWLTFESRGDKLRLAPVPSGWERLSPERLDLLRRAAAPTASFPEPEPADVIGALTALYRAGRFPCSDTTVHISADRGTGDVRMHADEEGASTVCFPEAAFVELVKHSGIPATETLLRIWLCTIYFDPRSYTWARIQ
jgi:hypothetical protein